MFFKNPFWSTVLDLLLIIISAAYIILPDFLPILIDDIAAFVVMLLTLKSLSKDLKVALRM